MKYVIDPSGEAPARAASAGALHAPPGSPEVRVHCELDRSTVVSPPTRAYTALACPSQAFCSKAIVRPSREMSEVVPTPQESNSFPSLLTDITRGGPPVPTYSRREASPLTVSSSPGKLPS